MNIAKAMKKHFALLALAAASACASAADVSITYMGKDTSSPVVRTSLTGGQVALGVLNYVDAATGKSFQAYCIEPSQPNALTAFGAQPYAISSFSGTQADLLQALYSSSFSAVQTPAQQAAFQLAIWEISFETTPSLNVTPNEGSFFARAANSSPAALDLANTLSAQANSYLAVAQAYQGPSLYTLTKLTNASYQDLIVATPVPEPETYALLLAGLAVVGGVARRRLPR